MPPVDFLDDGEGDLKFIIELILVAELIVSLIAPVVILRDK